MKRSFSGPLGGLGPETPEPQHDALCSEMDLIRNILTVWGDQSGTRIPTKFNLRPRTSRFLSKAESQQSGIQEEPEYPEEELLSVEIR